MPLSHQDTKLHKVVITGHRLLVKLSDLETLRQN